MEYQDNSYRSKIKPENAKKNSDNKEMLNSVVTGSPVTKKKSIGQKLANSVFDEDLYTVKRYIKETIRDTAKDAFRNCMSDGMITIIETLFGTGTSYSRKKSSNVRDFRDYTRPYSRSSGSRGSSFVATSARRDFDPAILRTKRDVEEVWNSMLDRIDEYGMASYMDLYRLSGMPTTWADDKYGWTSLPDNPTVETVRDDDHNRCFLLVMPKETYLN